MEDLVERYRVAMNVEVLSVLDILDGEIGSIYRKFRGANAEEGNPLCGGLPSTGGEIREIDDFVQEFKEFSKDMEFVTFKFYERLVLMKSSYLGKFVDDKS